MLSLDAKQNPWWYTGELTSLCVAHLIARSATPEFRFTDDDDDDDVFASFVVVK
jgi:hypothetical protein